MSDHKMTPAEAGKIGGSVLATRPADFVQGNRQAKAYALQLGKEDLGWMPNVVEFYRRDPDVCILLAERFLELLEDDRTLFSREMRAKKAALSVILLLRTFNHENLGEAEDSLKTYSYESDLACCALTLAEIVQ